MKYLFNEQSDCWIDEAKALQYYRCFDGIAIQAGTLLGSGFEPYHLNGVTLPEKVNGIPVTELNGVFKQDEIGYIESTKLKRIDIKVIVEKNSYGNSRCCFPILCGGLQNTLQSIRFTFLADKANINRIEDPTVRSTIEYIGFDGKIIDDTDWDYGSFQSGLFEGCANLKGIHGRFEGYCLTGNTFEGCTSLISLPDIRVKYMGDREFLNCSSLLKVHLHSGLVKIGDECFKNCKSLTDLFIPDTVEHIGSSAFEGCTRLDTIHFSKAITNISNRLFANCVKLQKVFLSDATKTIGNEAFWGCASLKKPWLPEGLTSIGEKAFFGCVSMKEIFIPESLSFIGSNAFSECNDLVIHGNVGTIAEQYANENKINFVAN